MRVLHETPGLGTQAFGWQKGDKIVSSIGQAWLDEHSARFGARKDGPPGPDVFIATTLYPNGGHTALIGDFVRALAEIAPHSPRPHLIVTNCNLEHREPLAPATVLRAAIDRDRIDVLRGPHFGDRLDQLFARLMELRPGRLFLFHHPDDPVACAVVQPSVGAQTFLVHHADTIPSIGLYLPGIRIIDVTPHAAATSRVQGFAPALLLLTRPDPGPRPVGFLQRGKLVTATCGGFHKFRMERPHSYPDAVGVILRATGGWHVHIGPLKDDQLSAINDVLASTNLSRDRFVHIRLADSLATALWKNACDLYFASFPMGGARADVEVFASATPHLCFTARPKTGIFNDELRPVGGLVWRSLPELAAELATVSNVEMLEEKSKLMRTAYDRLHHPRVFAAQLGEILKGNDGVEDPQAAARERRAIERMLSGFQAQAGSAEFSMARFQELVDRVAASFSRASAIVPTK